jgi:hypothetical protein
MKSDSASSTASPTATPTATPGPLTITVTAEVEADETAGVYYVTSIPSYIFEDDVHVTVNQKHLLSAGNVTTEDKTAEIVAAVASLVAGRTFVQRAEEKAEPFDFSFHPSCPDEVDFVTRQLWRRGIGLTVDTEAGPSVCAKRSRGFGKELEEAAREFSQQGLLFRPGVSYKIRLVAPVTPAGKEPARTESWAMKNSQQFILPDPTKLYAIEYSRVAFVKKVRNVGFNDGMLTDFQQHLPSPVLGFLGIPKAIIQAMVPIPAATDAGSGSTSGTNPPKN